MYNRRRTSFVEERDKLLDSETSEEGAISAVHNIMRLWNNPGNESGRIVGCHDTNTIPDLLRHVASNTEEMPTVRREALMAFAKHFIPKSGGIENSGLIRFLTEHWDFLDNRGQGAENVKAYAKRCWLDVIYRDDPAYAKWISHATNLMVAVGEWEVLVYKRVYNAIPAMRELVIKHSLNAMRHAGLDTANLTWPHWSRILSTVRPDMGGRLDRKVLRMDNHLLESDVQRCVEMVGKLTHWWAPNSDEAFRALMMFSAFVSLFKSLRDEELARA